LQSCSHKWASVQKCAEARFFMAPVCEAPCKATSLRGRRDAVGGFDVTVRGLWKTTSLWHAPRTGMPLRLIRSIQFCCPRPASWSTNLDGYKTLQQPGCARPLQSFHADREIAAVPSRSTSLVSRWTGQVYLSPECRRQKAEGENTVFLSRTTRILIG